MDSIDITIYPISYTFSNIPNGTGVDWDIEKMHVEFLPNRKRAYHKLHKLLSNWRYQWSN